MYISVYVYQNVFSTELNVKIPFMPFGRNWDFDIHFSGEVLCPFGINSGIDILYFTHVVH